MAGQTDADGNEAITLSSTKPNASGYGPETVNGYYHSATFITAESDWSSVQNDNLRSGSFSDGPTTIPTGADAINRQGACPV